MILYQGKHTHPHMQNHSKIFYKFILLSPSILVTNVPASVSVRNKEKGSLFSLLM